MEPTPTRGSADPSADGGERDGAGVEVSRTDEAPAADGAGPEERPEAELPAPRAEWPALPRRRRRTTGQPPRTPPAPDPSERPHRDADHETLNRLLSGLRDI